MNIKTSVKKYKVVLSVVLALVVLGGLFVFSKSTILSTDAETLLNEVFDKCPDNSQNRSTYYSCIREEARNIFTKADVGKVMDAFGNVEEKRTRQDPSWGVTCHDAMHIFGEEAVATTGDISQVLGQCTRVCGFGCHHGAFSQEFRTNPDILPELSTICDTFSRSSFPGQEFTACNHGLGHGLADFAGRNIIGALKLCDYLPFQLAKTECATGVFMEIFDSPTLNQSAQPIPEDILSFCGTLPNNYRHVCFNTAGGYEYKRTGSIDDAFGICQNVPGEFTRGCFVGLGSDIYFLSAGDPASVYRNCSAAPNESALSECLEGALTSGLGTDPGGSAGKQLCEMANAEVEDGCFNYLEDSLNKINAN